MRTGKDTNKYSITLAFSGAMNEACAEMSLLIVVYSLSIDCCIDVGDLSFGEVSPKREIVMKVVLHICCGVCASSVAERLMSEGHEVIGFFCNPNIHPVNEYKRRLESADKVARLLRFPLVEDPCDPEEWLLQARPFESEPEGGKRCELCFHFRLERTYRYLVESGWNVFTTTLTCSPHKSAEVVNRVGQDIGGDKFLMMDFKKANGFNRSIQMAKQWKLYRQKYCGCTYSMR